jgi:hypothetical protein
MESTLRNNLYLIATSFLLWGADIMADIKFEIKETLGILSESSKGWFS